MVAINTTNTCDWLRMGKEDMDCNFGTNLTIFLRSSLPS